MARLLTQIERQIARFANASEGVAAVEFALILPVMLLVYVGTMEASALISMDRRVQTIAGTVGDLVARADGEITGAEIDNYFNASTGIMQPYSSTDVRQVVTSVLVKEDGTTEVSWSRGYHGGTPHATDSTYALPSEMTSIALGQYVIVAEAWYSYTPLLGIVFDQPISLYRENFYIPRFGEEIVCDCS